MHKLFQILTSPIGWLIFLVSHLTKRDPALVVFGTHINTVTGNIKALLEMSTDPNIRKVFIARNEVLYKRAKRFDIEAYRLWSFHGISIVLRAKYYVYSSYPSDICFWLSGGAKYINVWHGTPLKKIEKDITTGYYGLRNRYKKLYYLVSPAIFITPDLLLCASEYEKSCFQTAFGLKSEAHFFDAFPPRLLNVVKQKHSNSELFDILYVPTWRDDHSFRIDEYLDLDRLDSFLQKHNMNMTIKLHPSDQSQSTFLSFSYIDLVDKNEDIYRLLAEADLVISDYSSIIFDCLYMHIPVVLFCPDYSLYQQNSRTFYVDPSSLPVHFTCAMEALLGVLERLKSDNKLDQAFRPYAKYDNLLVEMLKKVDNV